MTAFRAAWADFAGRLHRFLDSDGDGVLTLPEAQRGNWQQSLLDPINRRPSGRRSRASPRSTPPRGTARCRGRRARGLSPVLLGFGEFGLQPGPPVDPKAQALFAHLDLDHDGSSRPPSSRPRTTCVARLDLDEDELISLTN